MTTDEPEPGQPHPFEISRAGAGDWFRIALRGDVDVDTSPQLSAAVDDALGRGRRHVAVDMGAVTFLDSTGLTALLRARDAMASAGGSLRVTSASPVVVRLLEITELTDLLAARDEPS